MTKFEDSFAISTSASTAKPPLMPTTTSSPSILTSNSSFSHQTVSFSISPPDSYPPAAKLNVSFTQDVEFNEKMSKNSEQQDQVKLMRLVETCFAIHLIGFTLNQFSMEINWSHTNSKVHTNSALRCFFSCPYLSLTRQNIYDVFVLFKLMVKTVGLS